MSQTLITAAGILLVGSITTLLIRDGRVGIEYLKADLRAGDPDGLAYMGLIIAAGLFILGAGATLAGI